MESRVLRCRRILKRSRPGAAAVGYLSSTRASSEAARLAFSRLYRSLPVRHRAEFVACMKLISAEFESRLARAELRDRIGEQVGHA